MAYNPYFDEMIKSFYLVSSGLKDVDYFLDSAGRVFNSHLVGCIKTDKLDSTTQMPFFKGVSESDKENYNTHFANKNILITKSIRELLEGQIVASADVFTLSELSKTEFYAGYMKYLDAQYTAGFMLSSTDDAFYTLVIARPQTLGAYSPDEKQMLRSMSSHARTAMQINSHLTSFKSAMKVSSFALDQLNMGVCTLGTKLKVLDTNIAAKGTFKNGGFLTTQSGYLAGGHLLNPKLAALLHKLSEGTIVYSKQIRLVNGQSGSECLLSIFPIQDADELWWVDSGQAKYILFIGTQFKPSHNCMIFIQKEFALTGRELEILGQLVMGRSLTSLARHLGISHETARSHMKSIFSKMDVHSQAQLAVNVLSLSSI